MFGHRGFQPVIQAIIKLAEKAAKEPWDFQPPDKSKYKRQGQGAGRGRPAQGLRHAREAEAPRAGRGRRAPRSRRSCCRPTPTPASRCCSAPCSRGSSRTSCAATSSRPSKRIDGRDLKTVRPIVSEVHVLPRTHGSALFTRGETQALVVATLGTGEDEQYVDALEGTRKERFLLHYNFPPYSVGETGRMGSPGRREIGHGKLAWRAVHPLMPSPEEFPYTVRVVSEITESNGSSSMATVCGASLALMDAGVPLKRPVAGIAMGLIKEGNELRRALRHPGRRGPPRRHGLQGGRHREGRHLAADGHQDRRHHRGDHAHGAGAGQRRPPAHPGRDGARPSTAPAPSSASTRRASRPSRSRSTRSAR